MEDISKMKVADLKKELKKRDLSITGNKQELIERLEEAVQADTTIVGDDDEEFDEDEILEPKEVPKSAKKKLAVKRAADTPAKATPKKVAKEAPATNGVSKPSPTKAKVKPTETKEPATDSTPEKKLIVSTSTDESESKTEDTKLSAKQARAERFGIPLVSAEKLNARADRFGVSNGVSGKTPVNLEVLKSRAERFGEVTAKSLTKLDTVEKKKAREDRFASGEVTEEEKKAEKRKITLASDESLSKDDETKLKRAERFAV